ncbi:hypothetical protein GIB67_025162 [Kingdonia uniflora]|uniref:DUF8040 domain-containing protein n=1 Tax=Kingdonia uniflora TaxID=39325 RepID=A0A7J7N8T9_9MAGN|nr:hypothetical protein GIB67_025162 [Kingdonia uniflora]
MDNIDDENKRKVTIAGAAVAAYVVGATASLLLNIPIKPYTNKDYEREKYMEDILTSEELCRANLRMGIQPFHRLCSLVRDKGLMQDDKNCKVKEVMMRFLNLMGHNVRHRVLEARFHHSRETISRQFNKTLNFILKLYKCLVNDHAELVYASRVPFEISSNPRYATYFRDCVGTLDGTHVVASVPIELQD